MPVVLLGQIYDMRVRAPCSQPIYISIAGTLHIVTERENGGPVGMSVTRARETERERWWKKVSEERRREKEMMCTAIK